MIEKIITFLFLNFLVVIGSVLMCLVAFITGMGAVFVSPYLTWLWFNNTKRPLIRRKQHGKN
jgi:hypothetical protein